MVAPTGLGVPTKNPEERKKEGCNPRTVSAALRRMEQGSFGECVQCGGANNELTEIP